VVFDGLRTVIALAVLYALLAIAFIQSPMPMHAVRIVLLVFAAFGGLVFYVGFRHGQYRARRG
jgi:hypothetical protein